MDPAERQSALERARKGDTQDLGELLQGLRPYVRVIVRAAHDDRLIARVDDSDLVQEVFLEAHRAFPGFRGTTVGEFVMWLRQIARRTASRTFRTFAGTAKRDLSREQPAEDLDL